MLCPQYIQKGLPFTNLPPNFPTHRVLSLLESSLSDALRHFYPLAGHLQTQSHRNLEGQATGLEGYIDYNDEGTKFIHAVAKNITAHDVVYPGKDIPSFVNSFFIGIMTPPRSSCPNRRDRDTSSIRRRPRFLIWAKSI
ncbi:hypothetical protein KSP39_PZI022283 [Platanthera zijinensis]|uniref:Uncharacterized protein n=1 Tax=Platanthera zijinensis TaxID=2320716 RepID=A0AAP0FUT4_9ASPA